MIGRRGLVPSGETTITSSYLHDGQTNVRTLADGTGLVTDTYDSSAYGELLSETGSTVNA